MTLLRQRVLTVLSLAMLGGCVTADNGQVQIPENALIYKMDPSLLRYTYTDTTAGHHYFLTWLPAEAYVGINCLGLVPRSAVDTTGIFVFAHAGPNTGRLERIDGSVTDTATAFFLPTADFAQGTHGTYAVDASGKLKLFWGDGTQTRYFDPAADIRVVGDTIRSIADQRVNGDSLRITWEVYWTATDHC